MQAEISKTFWFEAAHRLPNVPADHKCSKLHGHSYRVIVTVVGQVEQEAGWVMDFAEIKRVVEPIIEKLDHSCLNDIEGLENPTSEMLAVWLWQRIKPHLSGLASITVSESENSSCTYRGD